MRELIRNLEEASDIHLNAQPLAAALFLLLWVVVVVGWGGGGGRGGDRVQRGQMTSRSSFKDHS